MNVNVGEGRKSDGPAFVQGMTDSEKGEGGWRLRPTDIDSRQVNYQECHLIAFGSCLAGMGQDYEAVLMQCSWSGLG